MKFREFVNVEELRDYVRDHDTAWYQGPMNDRPMVMQVRSYFVHKLRPELNRVTGWTKENGLLTFNLAKHLDRFKCPVH